MHILRAVGKFLRVLEKNIAASAFFFALVGLMLSLSASSFGISGTWPKWVALCLLVVFSGVCGGLQFGITSLSRSVLSAQAQSGDKTAARALSIIKRATFYRDTLMITATGMGIALAQLTDELMPRLPAFVFTTVLLVLFAEIVPSKFFTQGAAGKISALAPVIAFFGFVLHPLVALLGFVVSKFLSDSEGGLITEKALTRLMRALSREEQETGISWTEARMVIAALEMDDLPLVQEAIPVHEQSVFYISRDAMGSPVFPTVTDDFFQKLAVSRKRFLIICDPGTREPYGVLDIERFAYRRSLGDDVQLGSVFFKPVILGPGSTVADVIERLRVEQEHDDDLVIDHDVSVYFDGTVIGILTGADLLGLHYQLLTHKTRSGDHRRR